MGGGIAPHRFYGPAGRRVSWVVGFRLGEIVSKLTISPILHDCRAIGGGRGGFVGARAYPAVMLRSAGMRRALFLLYTACAAACASSANDDADGGACASCGDDAGDAKHDGSNDAGSADARAHDGSAVDANATDGAATDGAANDGAANDGTNESAANDGASDGANDAAAHDTGVDTGITDAGVDTGRDTGTVGPITGGPCTSGAAGATAYRIRWADAGGQAQAIYEVDGLPDRSRNHAAAYGYQIGFTSQFVDPYLGEGGLLLDGSDFVDLEISTAGLASIAGATLSIYGRSFNTTASGSFNWQTFVGTGSTPTDFVSNVVPYQWYSADFTTEITPGDGMVLVRIKAGGGSGSLVVHRIEICMQAS